MSHAGAEDTTLQIVAHRGWWSVPEEQNSLLSFDRALSSGFGIETDLWWRDGEVLLSHDPPSAAGVPLAALIEMHRAQGSTAPLALNAKCDALFTIDPGILAPLAAGSYFFFDMSVPDMLGFQRAGLPFFTRQSELESDPVFYADACGVWLDQFFGDWIDVSTLARHAGAGKSVCIVSPELHGRPYVTAWTRYRDALASLGISGTRVMLCTDYPMRAREFFER